MSTIGQFTSHVKKNISITHEKTILSFFSSAPNHGIIELKADKSSIVLVKKYYDETIEGSWLNNTVFDFDILFPVLCYLY